ncbi:hypothetical protein KC19_VG183500 [Ceratodon purpureus]|uniref:Uncharacterized protein n=1 Tax=Ceratodon purpureus TaxID=3225 RepID=A0A8T0HR88_CERPU|nr:hypothetical protein KC19_VG183500 [Ceratodon purpureus]
MVNRCNNVEFVKKKVQLATLFHILSHGRPLLEYESMAGLFSYLEIPHFPRKHWSDNSGWTLFEYMFAEVKTEIVKQVSSAQYVALTADETGTLDNGSWISVHGYVVQNWVRIQFLISRQQVVDGAGAATLTDLLVKALKNGAGLDKADISTKLLSFGADGPSTFQGAKTGVTQQL